MSIAKVSVGKSCADEANAEYIARNGTEKIGFFNLPKLESDNIYESQTNAIAFALSTENMELATNPKGRTHYRMILSWDWDETSEKIESETKKYLETIVPYSEAIITFSQRHRQPTLTCLD